jgi:hypothetical protein
MELAVKNRTVDVSKKLLKVGLQCPVTTIPNGLSNTQDSGFSRPLRPVTPAPVAEVTIEGCVQLSEECPLANPVLDRTTFDQPTLTGINSVASGIEP